MKKGCGFYKVV